MSNQALIASIAVEILWIGGGGYCAYIAIKKGFIDRRMKRRDEVFVGADAVKAGILYLLVALFAWFVGVLFLFDWCAGRVY